MPPARKPRRAGPARTVASLADIPNVGPATVGDLRRLGITRPAQLARLDGLALYRRLCRVDAVRHDPCCADVFLAATDYMRGAPARPWWWYTKQRKRLMKQPPLPRAPSPRAGGSARAARARPSRA